MRNTPWDFLPQATIPKSISDFRMSHTVSESPILSWMTSAPRHEAASAPAVPALPAVPQRERVFAFRDFVLRRFGPQIFTESARLPVLDVAGGKGDLSWLLKNADDLDAVVVDPRVTDHTKITRTALWHYQILCVAPSKLFLVTDAGFFFCVGCICIPENRISHTSAYPTS